MDFTPHTTDEISEMLRVIGVSSIKELFSGIPDAFEPLHLPEQMDEADVIAYMRDLASRNKGASFISFLGAGAYDHYVYAAVHHLTSRGEFLTAYTPYQPEASQGTLQAQFEFQTMVASLLGMDAANASMYEGATALAEACLMCLRQSRRPRVVVSAGVHPEYRAVLHNYIEQDRISEFPVDPVTGASDIKALASMITPEIGAVVLQSPNFFGVVEDTSAIADLAHKAQSYMIATFTEAMAFGLIEPPGRLGADVAAGEGQSLGLPLSFGGPYVGLFAVKQPFIRAMPGRLIGLTTDRNGSTCYTLTLAAREQHIRRERASSNICTNEGLCAVAVAIQLSLLGKTGFQRLALFNHIRAEKLKSMLSSRGIKVAFDGPTFNEFVVRLRKPAELVYERLTDVGLVPGFPLSRYYPQWQDLLLITVTERRTDAEFERLVSALEDQCLD